MWAQLLFHRLQMREYLQQEQTDRQQPQHLKNHPQYLTATSFLADIYMKDGKKQEAILLYQQALKTEGISAQDKQGIQQAIASIQQGM